MSYLAGLRAALRMLRTECGRADTFAAKSGLWRLEHRIRRAIKRRAGK
jgi:hypothetical protein